MNLIKYGVASVVIACVSAVACGGSSSGNGTGSGAGSGNSTGGTASNSAGASSTSTGGSSTSTGGGSTSHGGSSTSTGGSTTTGTAGSTTVGSGGACNPTAMMGAGGSGAMSCPAATTCIETKCKTQLDSCTTTSCTACANSVVNCVFSKCLTESLSCSGTGGSGVGGGFSFDAGTQTCGDLKTCCGTIADANQKAACNQVVASGLDFECGLTYSSFCP